MSATANELFECVFEFVWRSCGVGAQLHGGCFRILYFPFYLQQPTLTWKTAELQLKNWMIWVSLKTFQVISRKSLNCTMGNGIIVKLSLKPALRVTNLCRIHYIYPPISSLMKDRNFFAVFDQWAFFPQVLQSFNLVL